MIDFFNKIYSLFMRSSVLPYTSNIGLFQKDDIKMAFYRKSFGGVTSAQGIIMGLYTHSLTRIPKGTRK